MFVSLVIQLDILKKGLSGLQKFLAGELKKLKKCGHIVNLGRTALK